MYQQPAAVTPPFAEGERVVCLNESWERDWQGHSIQGAMCAKGQEYTIDGCVWSYAFGWMVSITGELHPASDFRSPQSKLTYHERQKIIELVDDLDKSGDEIVAEIRDILNL